MKIHHLLCAHSFECRNGTRKHRYPVHYHLEQIPRVSSVVLRARYVCVELHKAARFVAIVRTWKERLSGKSVVDEHQL